MESSKRIKYIEFFNEHVFNEANKILPHDTESTITGKMMADNLSLNVILDSPFRFHFPNSADWVEKKRSEIKAKYPDECKYFNSAFECSMLLQELEPMYLASDSVSHEEKDLYLKAKEKKLAFDKKEF